MGALTTPPTDGEWVQAPVKSPFNACFWVADTCNLSCKYCYAAPFRGRKMEKKRAMELIDEVVDLEVINVLFGGGEPLLNPDVFDMMAHSVARGARTAIMTNGVLLDEPRRRRLIETFAGKPNFQMQVSLDSADPEMNDRSRGQGRVVLDNLRAMRDSGIEIQVATVLTRANLESAHLIIDALYPAVKRFHFMNLQLSEETLKHPEILIRREEADRFWLHLQEHAARFPSDLFLPSLRAMLRTYVASEERKESIRNSEATFACSVCSVALTTANFDADFHVYGCDIAKKYTWLGNAAHTSFAAVWNSRRAHEVRSARIPHCFHTHATFRGMSGDVPADTLAAPPPAAAGREAEQGR